MTPVPNRFLLEASTSTITGGRLPKVSICVPTYNRARWLKSSLDSILSQTYTDFELVVVDNCSEDDTETVVRSLLDPRVRYVRSPNHLDKIENFNRAIQEARCSWIALYHDDDFYHPDILRRSVEILQNNPRVGVVCAAVHSVDPVNPDRILATHIESWPEVMPGGKISKILAVRWDSLIAAPTALVRRSVYENMGGWRSEYGDPADRELWLRVFTNWDLGYIREPMASLRARVDHGGVNARRIWENLQSQVRIQEFYIGVAFRNSFGRCVFERCRLRAQCQREFWKTALWSIARGHTEVTLEAIRVFREEGLVSSAKILERMQNSRSLKALLRAERLYA